MKERPIIFSGPMVRAILEGIGTQARLAIKPQPDEDGLARELSSGDWFDTSGRVYPCPYGKVGDRLWVRETWLQGQGPTWGSHCVVYDADKKIAWAPGSGFDNPDLKQFKKRPSIFMPRWASRITLEITSVRVERLQEISEEDARAEGVTDETADAIQYGAEAGNYQEPTPYRTGFSLTWQSIHGTDSWHANPWVWVLQFKRVES
jgi:hypothetical protein